MATNNSQDISTGSSNTVVLSTATPSFVLSSATYPSTCNTGDIPYGSASNVYSNLAQPTNIPGRYVNYNSTNMNWFNNLSESYVYDDLISGTTAGNLNWRNANSGTGSSVSYSGDDGTRLPGTITFTSGTTASGYGIMQLGNSSTQSVILGGGLVSCQFIIVTPSTASGSGNTYVLLVGLMGDSTPTSTPANGVYWTYSSGSVDWVKNTSSASTTTSTATTTSVITNTIYQLRFDINAAASSVSFFINNSSAGSALTTNIPTVALSPTVWFLKTAGTTSRSMVFDYFSMYQSLTSAR